jgi:hypothetical protein
MEASHRYVIFQKVDERGRGAGQTQRGDYGQDHMGKYSGEIQAFEREAEHCDQQVRFLLTFVRPDGPSTKFRLQSVAACL